MTKRSGKKANLNSIKALEAVRRRYKAANLGHRSEIRQLIVEAAEIGYALRTDEKQLNKFKNKRFWNDVKPPKNVIHAAMMYMANAKTGPAYQLAGSRARCAEYLHDFHGVAFADMAREIAKRGGYKKIAKDASEGDPRQTRQKAPAKKPTAVKFTFDEKRLKRIEKYEVGQQVRVYATLIDKSRSLFEVTKVIKSDID